MDNLDAEPRAKRQKTKHKSAAFDRLKQLKGKGTKNKYEVSDLENVYEVVDEKEYSKKVLQRQDDDWIVDDDGSGYVEDGREIFDDDLDGESIANASKNDNRKKKKNVSKPGSKGNIQAMLSNMPEKKRQITNLEQDDALSDILSGLDETPGGNKQKSTQDVLVQNENQAVKDYMKSFSVPKPVKVKLKSNALNEKLKNDIIKTKSPLKSKREDILEPAEDDIPQENGIYLYEADITTEADISSQKENILPEKDIPNSLVKNTTQTACKQDLDNDENNAFFDDDFDLSGVDEVPNENEDLSKHKTEITEENLIDGWETMQSGVTNESEMGITVDCSQLPLVTNKDGEQVFRFFWWDANEYTMKQPGVVFLFGKTYIESAKSYASCCIIVRNIERKIYLLPRPFKLNTDMTESNEPVKMIDVYHEFNKDIADRLRIQQFRSRKVTKKYAFNPNIPSQSDYLEIRYAANHLPLSKDCSGKTISHVFGTQTSFLEILLLEKKIKGPCWIDIKNPKPTINPLSWCKFEINCLNVNNIYVVSELQNQPPPPLVVATLNTRSVLTKEMRNEVVMIGCLVHNKYYVDKQPPNPHFQQHFCVFTRPSNQMLPPNYHEVLNTYKGTQVQKCDSERALLNYFLTRFAKIDPDLVVGHDLFDYQINLLCNRLDVTKATHWSRFGKLRRTKIPTNYKVQQELMVGRLVCDLKVSGRELIKSRSYDLDTLCQTVLKIKDGQRPIIESGDVLRMFGSTDHLMRLIGYTMQDAAYITKMMYELNAIPLALQITNIAGNVMSRTLQGGRAERNEYLLLHAFTEKDYIPPDKMFNKNKFEETDNQTKSARKKPTYSGGLVLDPKVGFYDKLILLMDFNSLYPSIIQEYNICFTTMSTTFDENGALTCQSSDPGILPIEIKKLVESRRQVKYMMANPDISNDLRMQYNIRQLALKLTANSMYGCLGFSNSRFFAKHLASYVTMKGRDILMHTRDIAQSMGFEVIYGDTDSIMINTNILDYDQVFKIGNNIKQAVNKSYRQVELDVDGVFRYMLLLKKKKYAALTMTKSKNGNIVLQQEHKGLDIVRRDWSVLASEVGKTVVNHILSEQSADERIENIQAVLKQIASDLNDGKIPLPLLVITKQLTKNPNMYGDKNQLSHVLVALRYNQKGNKPLGQGDAVAYVICDDGTTKSYTQRAYHVEEFKNSNELKIDIKYYLTQQIHPVITRLCEPIDGLDAYQIANALGIDSSSFKQRKEKPAELDHNVTIASVNKYQSAEPLQFTCPECKTQNVIKNFNDSSSHLWLEKCENVSCTAKPLQNLNHIQNELVTAIKGYIEKYYECTVICEDPMCPNETNILPQRFVGKYPVCNVCGNGIMYKKYTECDLYGQLSYFKSLCDLSKTEKKPTSIEAAYQKLKESVEYFLDKSRYSIVNLTTLFDEFKVTVLNTAQSSICYDIGIYENEDDF